MRAILSAILAAAILTQCRGFPAADGPELPATSPLEVNALDGNETSPQLTPLDPETTVQEVEELLKRNPQLPRLTRGEIVDILENITAADEERLNRSRGEGKRALMLVMPYTPERPEDVDGVADLYTKPPVTRLVGGDGTKKPATASTSEQPLPLMSLFPDIKVEELATSKKPHRRRRPELKSPTPEGTTSTRAFTEPLSTTGATPAGSSATPVPVTTYKPRPTSKPRKPARRRSTVPPTTRFPNHKYPEEKGQGLALVEAPNLGGGGEALGTKATDGAGEEPFLPLPDEKNKRKNPLAVAMDMPDDLKSLVKDLELEEALKRVPGKFSSHYKENPQRVVPLATQATPPAVMPDVSGVADTLNPEMKELLMSFGLIPDPNPKKQGPGTQGADESREVDFKEHADTDAESYVSFKPLPESAPTRDDMEAFFASFGLGRGARKQKALKEKLEPTAKPTPALSLDMVPEPYLGMLGDMGLAPQTREGKRVSGGTPLNGFQGEEQRHVFSPAAPPNSTDEEMEKLNRLLEMIRELEKLSGNATDDDLKSIDMASLNELVGSLNKPGLVPLDEQEAPNPLAYDAGLEKNEVKRQENATGEGAEGATPSLKDLEESFGGSPDGTTAEPPPPVEEEPAPAPKRTGFYYLVDWNTFLDIDNQKGKRVNLRFQPTVGDPKRFLSVSVP